MNPIAAVLRFGDLYLLTALIESIQFLDATTVEIHTRNGSYIMRGTSATDLRTYLETRSQSFTV